MNTDLKKKKKDWSTKYVPIVNYTAAILVLHLQLHMADQVKLIDPNFDPYGYLGFVKSPDGSVTRLPLNLPEIPASDDPTNPFYLSKDIIINQSNKTWVRLFVSRKSFDSDPITKLPILIYFHGGGFVLASPA